MILKKHQNLIMGIIFLLFSIFYTSQIGSIKITDFAPVDSAFFPKALIAIMFLLSILQIGLSIKDMSKNNGKEVVAEEADYLNVIKTFGLSLMYVLLLEPAGFIISSTIYAFLEMIVLCPKNEYQFVKFALISFLTSLIIFLLFKYGLGLVLPRGILGNLI